MNQGFASLRLIVGCRTAAVPLVAHAAGETRIPTYAMVPYRSAERAEESRNKRIEKLQGVRSRFIDRPQLAADLE